MRRYVWCEVCAKCRLWVCLDADYVKFLEQLENAEAESVPPPEAYLEEIEARARDLKGLSPTSQRIFISTTTNTTEVKTQDLEMSNYL